MFDEKNLISIPIFLSVCLSTHNILALLFSGNFCLIFFAKFSHNFFHKIVALIFRTFLQNRLKQNFAKKAKILAFFTSERKARRSKKKKENWTGKIGRKILEMGTWKRVALPTPKKISGNYVLLRRNSRVQYRVQKKNKILKNISFL